MSAHPTPQSYLVAVKFASVVKTKHENAGWKATHVFVWQFFVFDLSILFI